MSFCKQILAISLIIPSICLGGIAAPFGLPSTGLLPKGIRNVSYSGIFAQGNEKYNEEGQVETLGQAFDKDVTFQDLIEAESPEDQTEAKAYLLANGFSVDGSVGSSSGAVHAAIDAHTPIFAYGVSNKWTIAVAVPVVSSTLNVDTGAVSNDNLQSLVNILDAPGSGKKNKIDLLTDKYLNAVNDKAQRNGYDPLESRSATELGDIKLVSKYLLTKNDRHTFVLENTINLPTARKRDVNRIIDLTAGDGQTDIGLGLNTETYLANTLYLLTKTSYTFQLPDTLAYRVPENSDTSITPDIDANTSRDLGDKFLIQFAIQSKFSEAWNFGAGYSYQYKGEDEYSGSQYAAERYTYIGEDTHQLMHAWQANLNFSTISYYKKKQFPVPMSAGINYSKAFAGENVVKDGVVSLNMSFYF